MNLIDTISEIASVYEELNKRWENDTCSTDLYQFYRLKEYWEAYNKLKETNFETITLEIIAKELNEKILIRLRNLLEDNIHIYETRRNDFTGIDFHKVFSLYEEHLFGDKIAILRKEKEDIQEIPYPTEQERTILLKENQTERNLLENERSEYIQANNWVLTDYYSKINEISQSFLSIINSYFPVEKENIFASEAIPEERVTIADSQPQVEPDMIFRTKMYEKFLPLEQKLIRDKFLNEDLDWTHTHKNKQPNIKGLITFLVGLLDNNYFLPNKNIEIKAFFENRYHTTIGQNFEPKRREPLLAEYKIVFYDYHF